MPVHRSLLASLLAVLATAAAAPGPGGAQGRPLGVRSPAPSLEVPRGALSFLVIGDWGMGGTPMQRKVAQAMDSTARALGAVFVVAAGDNFYPAGVKGVDDPAWRASFEDVYAGSALQGEWVVALGNHDYYGSTAAQVAYTARSRRWRLPAPWYAVRRATADGTAVELFILDTSPFVRDYRRRPDRYPDLARQDTVAQRRWLDSALTASTAPWKFVVGHHHVYSGGKRGTNTDLERFLVPRLERHGVAAYLCGHEHVLQHVVRPGRPVHYFISGAASQVRQPGQAAGTRYADDREGLLAFSVTAQEALVQAVDYAGTVRYVTRFPRPTASLPAAPAPRPRTPAGRTRG